MKRFKTVDDFVDGHPEWHDELIQLRRILCGTELEETVKWGAPCYTLDGKNLVGIGAFKSYCGLWFFQGALLSDPEQVLMNAQEGRTRAMRQWRFASRKEIKVRLIKQYVKEAILMQQAGHEIKPQKATATLAVPRELSDALQSSKQLTAAFDALTKGRQREYANYISEAKRAETREKRLAKIIPMITAGVGLNDSYRRS